MRPIETTAKDERQGMRWSWWAQSTLEAPIPCRGVRLSLCHELFQVRKRRQRLALEYRILGKLPEIGERSLWTWLKGTFPAFLGS